MNEKLTLHPVYYLISMYRITKPPWTKPPNKTPRNKPPRGQNPPDKTFPDKAPMGNPPSHPHKTLYKTPQTQATTAKPPRINLRSPTKHPEYKNLAKSKKSFILNSDGFRALLLI